MANNDLTTLKQERVLAIKILRLLEEILLTADESYQPKVEATAGNIAVFDSDGGIADSGFSVATDAEVLEYLNRVFPNT